jgi:hypothetical protein
MEQEWVIFMNGLLQKAQVGLPVGNGGFGLCLCKGKQEHKR